jgi:hypothetical protein
MKASTEFGKEAGFKKHLEVPGDADAFISTQSLALRDWRS